MKPLAITLQESHLSFTDNPEPRNYKVYRKDYYLGDFNAHNPLWGSKKLDDRGKEVEKFYSSHTDLFLLNTGEMTYGLTMRTALNMMESGYSKRLTGPNIIKV
ncbi:hypothetical protein M8J77_015554 [Diaphorina citri]|nr:hypothetical protein M8J77_015554 [Diaphorina citri]